MKTFLPLCAAALLLAIALPLSAAPDGDRGAVSPPLSAAPYTDRDAVLRDEIKARLQLLEDKLSLQQERRLDELKNELRQLQDERKTWLDDTQNPIIATAEKKKEEVRATGDRYVSMVSTNFSALGVLAAIIALVPAIFSIANIVSFNESAKQKLKDIERIKQDAQRLSEKYIAEFKESTQGGILKVEKEADTKIKIINDLIQQYERIYKEIEKKQQEIEKKQQRYDHHIQQQVDDIVKNRFQPYFSILEDKMLPKAVDDARKQVKDGKGIEVLRGQALLAMNTEQWEKACSYLEDIVHQAPDDASARFDLAKCQTFLSESNKISLSQRQKNISDAEKYYNDMLQHKDRLSYKKLINIYLLYSYLKKIQAQVVEAKERKRLYTEAEQLLQDAQAIIPQDVSNLAPIEAQTIVQQNVNALGSLAELKLLEANDTQTKPEDRTNLRIAAERLLDQAQKLAPDDGASYLALAQAKMDQANDEQTSPEKRVSLRREAERLLQQAPTHTSQAATLYMQAILKQDMANDRQTPPESQISLRREAEQLFYQLKELTPQDEKLYVQLARLKQQQAKDEQADPQKQACLYNEAEQLLFNLQELIPQSKIAYFALAGLKLHQASVPNTTPVTRENFYKEAEMLLLRAKELDPYYENIYIILASIKRQQAQKATTTVRQTLYHEAEQLLAQAKELAPQDTDILNLYIDIKWQQAQEEQNINKRTDTYKHINNMLIELKELTPYDDKIYFKLASISLDQIADSKTRSDQDALFTEAENFLRKAIELSPYENSYRTLMATLKITQASSTTPDNVEKFLATAESYLDGVSQQGEEKALYNRVSIAALRGQSEKALELLEECSKAGTLPSREEIESDKALDSLRDQDAFKKFMERAYPAKDSSQTKDDTEDSE